MTTGPKPPTEVTIEQSLVQALLHEHHTDLAHLALIDVGEAWDNILCRVGDDLAVRLPRRAASAAFIVTDARIAPEFRIGGPSAWRTDNYQCVRGCVLMWVERGINPNGRPQQSFEFSCTAGRCSSARVGGRVIW